MLRKKVPPSKFASRATIKRLSRAEVEDRIEDNLIELPFISPDLPVWWSDEHDGMLDEGITPEQFEQAHKDRQAEWTDEHKEGKLHPGAREALFVHGLRLAVQRASLAELNGYITKSLMDKANVPDGLRLWTHWDRRTATRLGREDAVFALLDWKDQHARK